MNAFRKSFGVAAVILFVTPLYPKGKTDNPLKSRARASVTDVLPENKDLVFSAAEIVLEKEAFLTFDDPTTGLIVFKVPPKFGFFEDAEVSDGSMLISTVSGGTQIIVHVADFSKNFQTKDYNTKQMQSIIDAVKEELKEERH
jgi:hypothetical protein